MSDAIAMSRSNPRAAFYSAQAHCLDEFCVLRSVTYHIYYCDARDTSPRIHELQALARNEYDTLRSALNAACDLARSGAAVWLIENSSGFRMERRDITDYCRSQA